MTMEKIELRKLVAAEGMVLTDGETYSDVGGFVYLGCNDTPDNWREITEEAHDAILAEQEREAGEEVTP